MRLIIKLLRLLVYVRGLFLVSSMDFYKAKFRKPPKFSKYISSESRDNASKNRSVRRTRDSDSKSQMYDATCGECGTSCQIPFRPRQGRPVLCRDCFRKTKPRDDRRFTPSREPRRGTREKNRDVSFRKTERYFEGGSETFYATLREKLFEVLGGKKCVKCGFSDERALGFSDIDDKEIFDKIRRGGSASSWGKYISNPDLARKKLQVLCLNCNQIK